MAERASSIVPSSHMIRADRWIGNAFLARALQSVSSTAVPFDPVLCMLAADLGASREVGL